MSRTRYVNYQQRRNYRYYGFTPNLLRALAIKPITVPDSELIELMTPIEIFTSTSAINSVTALKNLDGGQLAEITNEAYTGENMLALIELRKKLKPKYLTQDDQAAGLRNLMLTAQGGIGHFYLSLSTCPIDPAVYERLVRSGSIPALELARAFFLAFPGSFDTTDQPTMNIDEFPLQVAMDPPMSREERLAVIARSYLPKPLTERELQLDVGNFVIIGSAGSLLDQARLRALNWLNSTTGKHVFDGRVSFTLVPNEITKELDLLAIGYGQHPFSIGDWMNVTFGGAVFGTTLMTFIEALEHHAKKVNPGTDPFTMDDLDVVTKSLVDWRFPISPGLALRHFMFEAMNAVGGPPMQWARLVRGNTTTPPTPKITGT